MLDMEFVDTDYSAFLDYSETGREMEDGNARGIRDQLESEQATIKSSRPVEEIPRWSFGYCQQFFDVTTQDVLNRIGHAIKPLPSADFLSDVIQSKPDLYGPIWISVTLALELAITSDLAHLAQFSTERPWRSSVNTVYRASVLLFLYSWCLPALISIALEWNPIYEIKYKMTDLICIYGYASSVFLPAIAMWTLPILWLRWTSLLVATLISGVLICRSLKKAFVKLDRGGYYAIQILLFTVNLMIGISFNTLFFPNNHHPSNKFVFDVTLLPTSHYNETFNNHTNIPQMQALINSSTDQFNLFHATNGSFSA